MIPRKLSNQPIPEETLEDINEMLIINNTTEDGNINNNDNYNKNGEYINEYSDKFYTARADQNLSSFSESKPLNYEQMEISDTIQNPSNKFPSQIFLILANEFCERFTYYGIHAILVIYLTQYYMLKKNISIAIYHAFNMLCYLSPLFGALLADKYLGRYKTILYISYIYALGSLVLAITSIPSISIYTSIYGPMIGLILIGLGTGGIKPCVSAFGGDQFHPDQQHLVSKFFSVFYFMINFGSLLSMIIIPMLRSDVQCFSNDCYSLAFGLPAILMFLSIIFFLGGRKKYRCIPPEGSVFNDTILIIWKIIKLRFNNKDVFSRSSTNSDLQKEWLDKEKTETNAHLINDIRSLMMVLLLFLPIPFFWTLYDQQGSRWTIQAMEMNGTQSFGYTIKPDQIQALNPIMVMILIPLFECIIYPFLSKFNLLKKPLQRMCVGMLFVALSFLVAGCLQFYMESVTTLANLPSQGYSNFRILNVAPSKLRIKTNMSLNPIDQLINVDSASEYFPLKSLWPLENERLLMVETKDNFHGGQQLIDYKIVPFLEETESYTFIIGLDRIDRQKSQLHTLLLHDDINSASSYLSKVRFVWTSDIDDVWDDLALRRQSIQQIQQNNHSSTTSYSFVNTSITINFNGKFIMLQPLQSTEYFAVPCGSHPFEARRTLGGLLVAKTTIDLKPASVHTITLESDPNKTTSTWLTITRILDVEPRPINILWQIPQYLILTIGEVLFAVTGLDFAYSEAPKSMKSVIMACWLLTVSVGNLIVVILSGIRITDNMAIEFIFFGCLLILVSGVFSMLAIKYNKKSKNHLTHLSLSTITN